MAIRKHVSVRRDKKIFRKTASRVNVKNLPAKTMMRGGFHF